MGRSLPGVLTGEGEIERKSAVPGCLDWWLLLWLLPCWDGCLSTVVRSGSCSSNGARQRLGLIGRTPIAPAMRLQAVAGGSSMVIFTDLSGAEIVDQREWLMDPVPALEGAAFSWHGRGAWCPVGMMSVLPSPSCRWQSAGALMPCASILSL